MELVEQVGCPVLAVRLVVVPLEVVNGRDRDVTLLSLCDGAGVTYGERPWFGCLSVGTVRR